ncbi:type I secretion system permease/ATPase [Ramlibacter sp. AN1133]|uniref:type I secretion system permease/ATPase n=1 Tax=Ramlibacter sp. AN1133 TaxID=3133429 RepID=UPI0030BDC226
MNKDELRAALAEAAPLLRRATLFAVVGALLVLMPSWYMLEVYDRVVGSRSHFTLAMLTVLVIGAYIVMEVLDWAAASVLHEAGLRFERRLAPRVFDACFAANLRKLAAGGLQPLQDLQVLRDMFQGPAVRAAMEVPVAAVFLAIEFAIHPLLGWITLLGAVVQAGVAWSNERGTHQPMVDANRAAREAQLYADASLRNAQVIEAMGMLPDIHRRWMQRQHDYLAQQATASDRGGSWQAVSRFVQTTMASALLGLAAWLVLRGELQNGGGLLIVASILGGRVLAPLVALIAQWRTVVGARDAWERLAKLLATIPARPAAMALPAPSGRLAAENLVVPVPGSNAPVLRGVSFSLQPGEVLAVIGPTASGKTTLARTLVGLWPSAGGKVRLDGVDVFGWDKTELGPHVGYLPQGVELFDGTVAENIARFDAPDAARAEAAARKVGLHEFILSLPQGYDTEIGNEGARLSGGQRQRLALARALYGEPVFVVLDEPNASLDEAGDRALAEAIAAGKARGTTFVVMTHRTSILGVSDKLLVLADGQVQAFGPRDQVLAKLQKATQQAQAAARALQPQPAVKES